MYLISNCQIVYGLSELKTTRAAPPYLSARVWIKAKFILNWQKSGKVEERVTCPRRKTSQHLCCKLNSTMADQLLGLWFTPLSKHPWERGAALSNVYPAYSKNWIDGTQIWLVFAINNHKAGRQFCVIKKGPKKSPKRIFETVICLNSSKSQIF